MHPLDRTATPAPAEHCGHTPSDGRTRNLPYHWWAWLQHLLASCPPLGEHGPITVGLAVLSVVRVAGGHHRLELTRTPFQISILRRHILYVTAVTRSSEPSRIAKNGMNGECLILFPGTMLVDVLIRPASGHGCERIRPANAGQAKNLQLQLYALSSTIRCRRSQLVRFHRCPAACGEYERGAYDRRN